MKKTIRLGAGALGAAAALWPLAQAQAAGCEDLVGKKVGGGVVTSAERLAAGAKLSLTGPWAAAPIAPLPAAICRVKAQISPVAGSLINVEVWLPETWNGKFVGLGGGGYSGGLDTAAIMFPPLTTQGYATAATDVGHPSSEDAKWSNGQPQKLVDWAHRGNHVTAVFAKALIASHYAKEAQRSYFHGCSNGGRDALMEARRYPQDYDGIVAGAPAAPWTRAMTGFAWNMRALDGPPKVTLTPAKLKLVTKTVMARCDALDGVKDGLLEDPRACRFDPAELECKAGQSAECLSGDEVKALRAIYQGPRTRDGKQISAGFAPGGEASEWPAWITNEKANQRNFATETFRWFVHRNEAWTLDRFDLDRDFALGLKRMGPVIDSDNRDLRPFLKQGGKLILYHGWNDAALPPENSIAYYAEMTKLAGPMGDQARLFMAPGMGHCFGGEGPNRFDMVSELDRWFESGAAPERVIAAKPDNMFAALAGWPTETLQSRPLCAWPKRARWNGTGSTDDAANFSCVAAE